MPDPLDPGVTYQAAGVDIAAGDRAVERIRGLVASTSRPEVLGTIGGFGGCFALEPSRWRQPVLVASTDGVGTKSLVAQELKRFGTIGVDLVAMCVDDLVCLGAEPLFLLDYLATARLDPEEVEQLVAGVAEGCRQAGCALLGGEMAEHPGAMPEGRFDLAGFAIGAVERDQMLGPDRVQPGDLLVGIGSPGLRSNGYSLARAVLIEGAGLDLAGPAWEGAGHSLGDELLRPSVIYAPGVLRALATGALHAAAHVTGGGIAGNLARVIPDSCTALVERGSWVVPKVFAEIERLGPVDPGEMERVFNLGLGMVLVVEHSASAEVRKLLEDLGYDTAEVGRVLPGSPGSPDSPGSPGSPGSPDSPDSSGGVVLEGSW